jgi:hypothetical protein
MFLRVGCDCASDARNIYTRTQVKRGMEIGERNSPELIDVDLFPATDEACQEQNKC